MYRNSTFRLQLDDGSMIVGDCRYILKSAERGRRCEHGLGVIGEFWLSGYG